MITPRDTRSDMSEQQLGDPDVAVFNQVLEQLAHVLAASPRPR
jgi:hypothetical protein